MPEEKNLCSETNRRPPCGKCVKKLEPKVCAESDINVPRWNHGSQRKLASFSVHDLRRTASGLLNEAGFNRDGIEKCLAHEESDVRSIYNKAEYSEQRRVMLQAWADMIDAWMKGESVRDIVRTAKISASEASIDLL